MRQRSRANITRLGAILILVGSVVAPAAVLYLHQDLGVFVASVAAVISGVVMVGVSCRRHLYLWVIVERILAILSAGISISLAGWALGSGPVAGSLTLRVLVIVGLGFALSWPVTRVPMNVDSWFSGPLPPSAQKPAQRKVP